MLVGLRVTALRNIRVVDTSLGLEGSKTQPKPPPQLFVGMILLSREDTLHRVRQDQTLVWAVCDWRGARRMEARKPRVYKGP